MPDGGSCTAHQQPEPAAPGEFRGPGGVRQRAPGVCEQRRLGQLGQLLLRPERPGTPSMWLPMTPPSARGLVGPGPVWGALFVGRGYTSRRGVGAASPPITTRAQPQTPRPPSLRGDAASAVGRLSEYSHHFVSALRAVGPVPLPVPSADLQAQSGAAFRAHASRVPPGSALPPLRWEPPLACHGGRHGLIQAAVAASAEVAQGEVLFSAACPSAAPSNRGPPPSGSCRMTGVSALCAFPG